MSNESLDEGVEKTWKRVAGPAVATAASTAHSALCPIHGIVPGVVKATGVSAALTEYEVLEPFAYMHDVQVEYTSNSLKSVSHTHEHTTTHVGHSHEDIHPYTESVVTGTNVLLMALSLGYLAHSLYNTFGGTKK